MLAVGYSYEFVLLKNIVLNPKVGFYHNFKDVKSDIQRGKS